MVEIAQGQHGTESIVPPSVIIQPEPDPSGVVDVFRETRELLDRREALRRKLGGEALEEIRPLSDALHALKGELNDAFPMNESETAAQFAEIRDHLEGIYNAEMGALSSLRSFVSEYN
jgi:hypothetical protein